VSYAKEFLEGANIKPPSVSLIPLWRLLIFQVIMETGENFPLSPGLYPGYRGGNSKKGGEGLKVLIFHYVPQSHIKGTPFR
jgi:hypothetical protein